MHKMMKRSAVFVYACLLLFWRFTGEQILNDATRADGIILTVCRILAAYDVISS